MAVPRISKDDLKLRLDGAAGDVPLLLDVRLKYPYEHSTMLLPGAVRMAPDALDVTSLPTTRDIVVYDSDPGEIVAERVVARLVQQGYRAFVLEGGIADWATAKLPTDSKPAPQPAAAAGTVKG
jgi:rhodanese-related sulfurtransferase